MVQSLPEFLNLSLNICSPCQVLGDVYTEVLEATHPLHRETLSHFMDGHRSHVSIFLLTKVITKRRIILDMQFPNQPLDVKWKVVKVFHCPTLLMYTGLMSLSDCWQKLLQKEG